MFYMRDLIYNARDQLKLAKENYNDALAIVPYHFPTKLLTHWKSFIGGQKYQRYDSNSQPSNYQPCLSMEARDEYEQSADVGATTVYLEEDSPIFSYDSIMRVL